MRIVATTTWNSIGLIETFLNHYQKVGFDQVLAMDFDSADGTYELLSSAKWRNFVQLVPYPGIAGLDSSNIFLSIAKEQFGPDAACLFCDPDELLVTPSMTVEDLAQGTLSASAGVTAIPRFNVTAPRSVASSKQASLSALGALTLRINKRSGRNIDVEMFQETLNPPWIFTAIPGKVFVKLGPTVSIGDGDHTAVMSGDCTPAVPEAVYLLHYPFRTYEEFREKIRLATIDFAANQHLPLHYGWQVRRWITISRAGRLNEEYLQQFIPDEDLNRLLMDRTLTADDAVVSFHRARIQN
jgi:hypothetical protein